MDRHTILITGASGFVGQHLVRYLSEQGKNIRAIYNKNPPEASLKNLPNISWVQADLLDIFAVEEIMKDISQVYHCAAIVSFHAADKEKMLHFNVESTTNIVNQSLEQGIDKLVYVSSVASLGRNEKNIEITEDGEWEENKYNSKYSQSKYFAEMEVWRGIAEGLNAVIVNPGIILGEGNWDEGSAKLMKVVNKEFPYYTHGINAWVDVKDVVNILVLLMESNIQSERFIISAGNFSYKEIFTMMAQKLGKKPPHIPANNFLTSLVWRMSLLRSKLFGENPTVTKETARTAQTKCFYNNEKLFQYFPDYKYIPMEETITRMAAQFLKEKL